MIEGPFKHWQITVDFDELGEKKTKTTLTVVYDMPMGPLGGLLDKVKLKKIVKEEWKMGCTELKHCWKAQAQFLSI